MLITGLVHATSVFKCPCCGTEMSLESKICSVCKAQILIIPKKRKSYRPNAEKHSGDEFN